MTFRSIDPAELRENPFTLLEEGMLLTACFDGRINTMTVGWGGFGCIWGRKVVYVAVRPERYTFEFTEKADRFSFAALPEGEESRRILAYCGQHSGRDQDKIKACGLTVAYEGETPYFEESKVSFICRKMARPQFSAQDLIQGQAIVDKWYGGGFHHLYVAGIEKVLIREDRASGLPGL